VLSACGWFGGKGKAIDRRTADRWLRCEECDHRELDSVRARGNGVVPYLAAALKGPSDPNTANVKRQVAEAYVQVRQRGPVALDSGRYVNHYVGNYRSLYQSRAITGLAAIGTPLAMRALEAAQDSANNGLAAFQYRADVKDELDRAVEGRWASISAGLSRTCGTRIDHKSYCWGNNDQGQLGDSTTTGRARPTPITNPSGAPQSFRFIAIAAGDSGRHTCGVSADRIAYCWGDNDQGQLGDGSATDRLFPIPVAATVKFVGITTGGDQTCAWTPEYRAFCWGENSTGQLGDGTTTNRPLPTPVAFDLGPVRISAGAAHTCADSLNNVLHCWGANSGGQLGDGSTTNRTTPVQAVTPVRVKALSVGATHTCVLAQGTSTIVEGAVYCAGNNADGQLGDGSNTDRNELTKITDGLYLAVSAGENHTCAIAVETRAMYCWGDNGFGQLGTGSPADANTPQPVSGGLAFLAVSAGTGHTCGITIEGEAYCWGLNTDGQLGDNTTTNRPTPVKVVKPS
jgi:alpha-tubulin suppressor-like RCC1 family protein